MLTSCYGHVRAICFLPFSNARRHPTGTPSGVPVPEHDRGRGELQLCCHCETTLRADRYHWPSYLLLRGSRTVPMKGIRCGGATQDVAQRALPSSRTSTPPNLASTPSRRHPKFTVGGSDAQHHQRVDPPPFPPGKQTVVPVLLRDAPPKAAALAPSAEGRPRHPQRAR